MSLLLDAFENLLLPDELGFKTIESVLALADLLSKKLQFAFFMDGGINCHLLLGKFGTGNLDTVLEALNFVQKTSGVNI